MSVLIMVLLQKHFMPGDPLENVVPFKFNTDTMLFILEVQSESSKATSDSELCTMRKLLQEMEEEGIVDTSLMGHSVERPGTQADGKGVVLLFDVSSVPNRVNRKVHCRMQLAYVQSLCQTHP